MKISLSNLQSKKAKGEIDHYDQFFLLLQCFQNSSAAEVLERISPYAEQKLGINSLDFNTFYHSYIRATSPPHFMFPGFLTPARHTTLYKYCINYSVPL